MAMTLKDSEEAMLMGRVRLLLRRLADAWDPSKYGENSAEQQIAKSDLKEASTLSTELDRYK